jgi:hypothetical protein
MGIIESLISFVGSIMATSRMVTCVTCRKAVLIQRWGEERRRVLNRDFSIPIVNWVKAESRRCCGPCRQAVCERRLSSLSVPEIK